MKRNNDTITKAFICREIMTVDPGKSNGGIVKYTDRYESWPIKKMAEFEVLVEFFKYQAEQCELPLIFIEKINSFPADYGDKQSIGRAMQLDKMKKHYSELISAIKLSKIKYIEVMPRVWQGGVNVYIGGEGYKERKDRFKDIAKERFPGQKVVGWNADAFLLVEFAQMKLRYDQRWIHRELQKTKPKNVTNLFK
jgi:hypothetical protein